MRTTLNQQIQSQLVYIDRANSNLLEAQNRAISGKRIMRPSDDVAGTNRALGLRTTINAVDQYTNNISVTKPMTDAAMNAIEGLVDAVQKVNAIAVKAANPDFSGDARSANLTQLDDILSQLTDLANSKHLGEHLFSGTASDIPPLTATGGSPPYTYAGTSTVRQTQIMSGVSVPASVPGDQLFNFNGQAGAGTTDLFTMVTQLQDAIKSGDVQNVSTQLDNVKGNLDNLLVCSAQVGSRSARMASVNITLSDTKTRLQGMLSDTEDVDMAEAIVNLKSQENVYQAALGISSQMLNLSLASLQR